MPFFTSLSALLLAATAALPKLKVETPARQADTKISYAEAAKIAGAKLPNARLASAELEVEKGRLVYSFDLRTAGKSGIDEVQVDAMDGSVVSMEHEGPEDEAKEKAEDAKNPASK